MSWTLSQCAAVRKARCGLPKANHHIGDITVSKNRIHVTPRSNGTWAVKGEGNDRASAIVQTQKAGERLAKELLRSRGGGEAVIHGRDNRFRDSDTVAPASDPNPPRDQKH
jgi:hypothetical protein